MSSVLITSKDGHVLIDGGLTQTAPQIAANIAKLGFRLEDVKLIVNSHTHYDHAGGIAALQRASGAQVAASPAAKRALEGGGPTEDDPQFAFGPEHNNFPAVANVRAIKDGETLRVGDLAITVHFTPGHTPGGTSWSWQTCEGDTCQNMVYADSLNSVSAPGFKFSADAQRVKNFERSIDTVAGLKCDILLTPHPEAFDLDAKVGKPRSRPEGQSILRSERLQGVRRGCTRAPGEAGQGRAPTTLNYLNMSAFTISRLLAIDARDLKGLCDVLIDCVEGGASVNFMWPMTREKAEKFWRGVADGLMRGDRALAHRAGFRGDIMGTAQAVWAPQENQPHRADIAKMLVHRRGRRLGVGPRCCARGRKVARSNPEDTAGARHCERRRRTPV